MSIHYSLYQNYVSTESGVYAARVMPVSTIDLQALADRIVSQGSTVTRTDVLAVLEQMCEACESYLLEGCRIQVGGVFELYPRIKGNFTGPDDTFDPNRHRLDATGNAGSRVRTAVMDNGTVVKDQTVLPAPSVLKYADAGSGTTNTTVTPSNIGTVTGNRLKYDSTNADEGIWFVSVGGPSFKVSTVETNQPSKLTYLVPPLAAGDYYLEVRSKFSKDGPVRTGRLAETLTVEA